MNALVLFLIIIIIIIIIIIFIYVFSNTFVINSNNCQNKLFQNNCQNKFQNKNTPSIPKGCYHEEWGINSVGYELDTYPSIENYSYKFYNNNLMNTDQQNIPYNPGNNIPDN